MKKQTLTIFDFAGTLVNMRPPELLLNRQLLLQLYKVSRLIIITGARKAETKNILKKLDIKKYFDLVITKDDSVYNKPDKRLLEVLPKKYLRKRMIYLGDAKKDYLFAKNTSLPFCYIGKRKYGIYRNNEINKVIRFIVNIFCK